MANDLHKEHRKRVRKEFLEHGFTDDIPSHKLLETLLFFSIPRIDTNETAHRLLNEFGTVADVLEADTSELLKVDGVGENTAMLIKLILPLLKRYKNDKGSVKPKFNDSDGICEYAIIRYFGETKEVFSVMSFGNDGQMLGFDKLNEGDTTTVSVPIREVVKVALKRKAACVVIVHNHVGTNALPSTNDVEMTIDLKSVLNQMGIKLIDHVIIANDDAVSMNQTEKLRCIFE